MAQRGTQGTGANASAHRYAGLGVQFAASIGVFAYGGYWLDEKFGTLPLLLILGVFLGFALGTISLTSHLKLAPKKPPTDAGRPEGGPSDPPKTL